MSNVLKIDNETLFVPQTNNAVFPIDQQIFACELAGEINSSSSWGNRQAEHIGLSAFIRAKIRTCLGQKAKKDPWIHFESTRSGLGDVYGWESNFEPHILEIVTQENFLSWVKTLSDRGGFSYGGGYNAYQTKPYKTEVMSFLRHTLKKIALHRVSFMDTSYKDRIDHISGIIDDKLDERVAGLAEIAKELKNLPASNIGI